MLRQHLDVGEHRHEVISAEHPGTSARCGSRSVHARERGRLGSKRPRAFGSPPGPYDQGVRDDAAGRTLAVDDALVDQLEHGPLHRFAEYASLGGVIPSSGAGVDTIWDEARMRSAALKKSAVQR